MRIVIDMQGAQTGSRFRGIGRYTMNFVKSVARNRGTHEIILALNGLFPETIESIRTAFDGLLPQKNILVWHAPGPVHKATQDNDSRREVAELIREAFLASLQPDIIHICSLFEGFGDDAVTSIHRFDVHTPVSVILYDLIPLLNPAQYLMPNPSYKKYYDSKLVYLQKASRYLAISESSQQEGTKSLGKPATFFVNISGGIEERFKPILIDNSNAVKLKRKIGLHKEFILYAGVADERKNLPRLIKAYAALPVSLRDRYQLVLAGDMPSDRLLRLKQEAKFAGIRQSELCFTGYISDEELVQLYNLCALYVFPSWHEGFGLPALEAMACGAPVIAANSSSLPEVVGLEEALFDPMDVDAITARMQQVLEDDTFRTRLREHAVYQSKRFSWDVTAKRALTAWESMSITEQEEDYVPAIMEKKLYASIARMKPELNDKRLLTLSACLALNQPTGMERQLLLDVSELAQRNAKTGIQRVVCNVLQAWLTNPPKGWRVEPVYASVDQPYRYARKFIAGFVGYATDGITDEIMDFTSGDVFFVLDLQTHVQTAQSEFYHFLRRQGVVVKFLVYDLLCVLQPEYFVAGADQDFQRWLNVVGKSDGAVCISRTVTDELEVWFCNHGTKPTRPFSIKWFHLGADVRNNVLSNKLPDDAQQVLLTVSSRPSFLLVSTIEPRKGHAQTLSAFESLWAKDVDVNLIFAGKKGWMIEELIQRIRHHTELGKRLFWLDGISDAYLEQIYATSACLIAASYGEGFGLSLIEAAQYKLPLIVRDIPVFREVAGVHAFYFEDSKDPQVITNAVQKWLALYAHSKVPQSTNMPWQTWAQSAQKLMEVVLSNNDAS